jgi:hypothetical protein
MLHLLQIASLVQAHLSFKIISPYFTVYCISVLQSVLIKYWHILLVNNCQGNILVNYLLLARTKTDNNQIKFRNIVTSKHQAIKNHLQTNVNLHFTIPHNQSNEFMDVNTYGLIDSVFFSFLTCSIGGDNPLTSRAPDTLLENSCQITGKK